MFEGMTYRFVLILSRLSCRMRYTVDRGLPAITARLSYALYYTVYLYYRNLMLIKIITLFYCTI